MTCEELFGHMSDYFCGDLVVEACESIRLHITSCERCEIIIQSVQHTMRIVRSLPKCELPRSLEERLRKELEPHLR